MSAILSRPQWVDDLLGDINTQAEEFVNSREAIQTWCHE